ncbi:MAG: tyrosine-type recombinase/integrase [Bacteroidetes bacterium]|nr:tyrosine-type recombinase/integrase [Bacteroidota bacterium]
MEKLQYRPYKGLEIRCSNCHKVIHRNNEPNNGCLHPIEKTKYRAIIILPDGSRKRIIKTLVARNYDEAVKELIDLRNDISRGFYRKENLTPVKNPILLLDCMSMYIDFLSDVDVPSYAKKHNSERYIDNVNSNLKNFKKYLLTKNINIDIFKINDVNDHIVGGYYDFLNELTNSSYTFNNNVKTLRGLFTYLIDIKEYELKNVFKKIKLKATKETNISITKKDFYDLLKIISPLDSVELIGKNTRRNRYRDWLNEAYKLKAFTGRRDKAIFQMKWNMIQWENNRPIYISVPDYKANQLKNKVKKDELEFDYVPIIAELEALLLDLGLNENKDKNEFIIAPNEKSRINLSKTASDAFTFYFKKLDRNYIVTMTSLRHTYITANALYHPKNITKLLQHANYSITKKHYIDQKEIAKSISKDRSKNMFRVFPK